MPEVKLSAELRTEFGKGAARRIRRAHKVPAVLYGHGTDPIHISLPGHETLLALRTNNALLSIDIDGKAQLALPKQVQRDPLRHTIEHVDLVLVRVARRSPSTSRSSSRAKPPPRPWSWSTRTASRSRPRPPTSRPRSSSRSRVFGPAPRSWPATSSCRRVPRSAIDPEALIVNITAAQSVEAAEAELAEAEAEAGIEPTVAERIEDEEPATEPEPEPANA